MNDNKDLPTGKLDQLKNEAQQAVQQKEGKFVIQLNKHVQGIDGSKLYNSKEEAVDAAFEALKKAEKV